MWIPTDNNNPDFFKAFDKVPNERLPAKLDHYDVRGNLLNWIRSFLSDRTQWVLVEGHFSPGEPHLLHLEYPKEWSSAHCSSWRTLTIYPSEWNPRPDCLQMTAFCIGPSLLRPIPNNSRWTLTTYKIGKQTGSCTLTQTDMKLFVSPPNGSNTSPHSTSMGRSWLLPPRPSTSGSTFPTTYRGTTISIVLVRRQTTLHSYRGISCPVQATSRTNATRPWSDPR